VISIVNQDPNPEVYESDFAFAASAAALTTVTNTVFTNQGHNEQFMIYAIGVDIINNSNGSDDGSNFADYDVTIFAGPNEVPSNAFDISWISQSRERVMAFDAPIVLKFKQPLRLQVQNITAVPALGNNQDITIRLIGETSIIKV